VKREIKNYYNPKEHPIGRVGDVKATVESFDITSHPDVKADLITTNIQALVERGRMVGDDADADGSATGLKKKAEMLLKSHKPDLVIIDEGHHFPASSWEILSKAALEQNSKCKFLLLTATPQRGDGASYGITKVDTAGEEFYYLYSRKDAIAAKYLKSIAHHPIVDPIFINPTKQSRYEEENYILSMIKPAVTMLLGLRTSCEGAPIRMLITARTNAAAAAIMTIFNKTSRNEGWGLHAAAITLTQRGSGRDDSKLTILRKNFECDRGKEDSSTGVPLIDVGIQCKMLGEGYDNPWIAVSVFAHPAKSVSRLSQTHGRAVRVPGPHKINIVTYPRALESHLYYPDEVNARTSEREARKVVEEYLNCKDEDIESLFAAPTFKNLKTAHQLLGKLKTDDFVANMKQNFVEYHALYEEKRNDWKVIPAEKVANDIYKRYIGDSGEVNVRIIDFGCGIDGLFEHKLSDLVKARDAKGLVYTAAVDVGDFDAGPRSWPKILTKMGEKPSDGLDDSHTTFECEAIVGDYSSPETYDEGLPRFDAGVLCLSIMAEDALPRALLIALQTIKPNGSIFVVFDMWKFGVHAYQALEVLKTHLATWCKNFAEKTGFKVSEFSIDKGPPRMAYLRIDGFHEAVELEKLKGATMKSLQLDADPPTPMHAGEGGAGSSQADVSRAVPPGKRSLSFDPSSAGPSKRTHSVDEDDEE